MGLLRALTYTAGVNHTERKQKGKPFSLLPPHLTFLSQISSVESLYFDLALHVFCDTTFLACTLDVYWTYKIGFLLRHDDDD